MDRIKAMLRLQQGLNDATNGTGWEKGVTKNGKVIDWRRCIWLEAAELVDSYPWKHWKSIHADPDYDNIRIEVIDIWHFAMSEALRVYAVEERGDITALAEAVSQCEHYALFCSDQPPKHLDHYDEIAEVEAFVASLFSNEPIENLIDHFFVVAAQSGLNLDTLYKLYVGKNILNQFRQDHGYKEGTYRKEWDGREDNVVMQSILDSGGEITPLELYEALEAAYPKP